MIRCRDRVLPDQVLGGHLGAEVFDQGGNADKEKPGDQHPENAEHGADGSVCAHGDIEHMLTSKVQEALLP